MLGNRIKFCPTVSSSGAQLHCILLYGCMCDNMHTNRLSVKCAAHGVAHEDNNDGGGGGDKEDKKEADKVEV